MTEWILVDYACACGIGLVNLQDFNTAGTDPDADVGESTTRKAVPLQWFSIPPP